MEIGTSRIALRRTRDVLVALMSVTLVAAIPSPGLGLATPPTDPVARAVALSDTLRGVEIALVIETTAGTASGAASAASFRVRAVTGALGQSGVAIQEVRIDDLQIEPILERRVVPTNRRPPTSPRVVGYRALVPVTVVTTAVHRVDFLVDRAAGAGAHLGEVRYGDASVGNGHPEA